MPPQNLPPGRMDGCAPPAEADQDGRRERGGQSPQEVHADDRDAEAGQSEIELRHRAADGRGAAPASARSASCRGTYPRRTSTGISDVRRGLLVAGRRAACR